MVGISSVTQCVGLTAWASSEVLEHGTPCWDGHYWDYCLCSLMLLEAEGPLEGVLGEKHPME